MTAKLYIILFLIVSLTTVVVSAIVSYRVFKKEFMAMSEEERKSFAESKKKKSWDYSAFLLGNNVF